MEDLLFDFITFGDVKYSDLTVEKKEKVDRFITKLKEKGLYEKLLPFLTNRTYDVSEAPEGSAYTSIHQNNLPSDLADQIDHVWLHLND